MDPRHSNIDAEMVQNLINFLKAYWNAIFSCQNAPTRNGIQIWGWVGGMGGPPEEDFGGVSPDVQGPRTSEFKNLEQGGLGRLGLRVQHAVPEGRTKGCAQSADPPQNI